MGKLATLALCALLVGFGCQPKDAADGSAGKSSAEQMLADNASEQTPVVEDKLWLTPPKGWSLVANVDGAARHVRYADPQEPSHSLTVESRANISLGMPSPDPLAVLEQLAHNAQQECSAAEDFNTFTGIEHGYPTAVRLFICEATEQSSGRLTLLKLIQGRQQTFLVALQHQWAAVAPAPAAEDSEQALNLAQSRSGVSDRVAAWSLFMRSVRVCAASGCEPQTS